LGKPIEKVEDEAFYNRVDHWHHFIRRAS
jgi:hypothetical protein